MLCAKLAKALGRDERTVFEANVLPIVTNVSKSSAWAVGHFGLYFEISKHAIDLAMKVKECLEKNGYDVLIPSTTNQQFPILEDSVLETLSEKYAFEYWERKDETHSVIRICTSWATKEENIDELLKDLQKK